MNLQKAKLIADSYEQMKSTPNEFRTKSAYASLLVETQNQFRQMLADGISVELVAGKGEPYANSKQMMRDVKQNGHLFVLSTVGNFGQNEITDKERSENPLLGVSSFKGFLFNDLFRAVHDFYGHCQKQNGFGPIGEEIAWVCHSKMFSQNAKKAMTTETRGQNSWVNFGKHLRNAKGDIPVKGETGFVSPQNRPFAIQKTGILPSIFHS